MEPVVIAVARSATHTFTKPTYDTIRLTAGLGVDGDAHRGVTVKHRSRVARDPSQPNLRQVHLMHAELFDELAGAGYRVTPGDLGENITTRGIDLLGLSRGTRLRIGPTAVVEVTGLRNPCLQIDAFADGLLRLVAGRDADGGIVRRAGIMGIVLASGPVAPDDAIGVEAPYVHVPLVVV